MPVEPEALLRALADATGDTALWIDPAGIIRRVAGRPHEIVRWRVGARWVDAVTTAARDELESHVARAEGGALDAALTDGSVAAFRAWPDGAGGQILAIGHVAAGPPPYDAVVAEMPLVIYALDNEGRFTHSAGGGLRRLGLRPSEVVGQSVFELYGDNADVVRATRAALAGTPTRYTTEVGDRTFDTYFAPLSGPRGQAGAVGVSIDITERARLERDLALSQKMEALGRLAGGVAHDFNNLLTVILGRAWAARDAIGEGPVIEYVDEIVRAASRAGDLTRQLLGFSRPGPVHPIVVDLDRAVSDAARMLRRAIGRQYEFSVTSSGEQPTVRADPSQLEQLVVSLVLAARDAMPEGGEISVSTAVERGGPDLPPAMQGQDVVRLQVRDRGPGMDRQSVARVFEPVFATGPEAATGLGLAMAYGVVDQAGGCLRVHSEPGLGTVYSAWFPVVSDVSAQVEVTRAVPDRGRILLAEDDAGVTTVVRAALERDGHLLVATADGEQAWARFSAEPEGFDLLITDLVMARLGGRDLAMRVIAAAPNLPILFVSGYSAGAAALPLDERRRFLGKPFRPSDLTRAVRELLSLSTRPPR